MSNNFKIIEKNMIFPIRKLWARSKLDFSIFHLFSLKKPLKSVGFIWARSCISKWEVVEEEWYFRAWNTRMKKICFLSCLKNSLNLRSQIENWSNLIFSICRVFRAFIINMVKYIQMDMFKSRISSKKRQKTYSNKQMNFFLWRILVFSVILISYHNIYYVNQ